MDRGNKSAVEGLVVGYMQVFIELSDGVWVTYFAKSAQLRSHDFLMAGTKRLFSSLERVYSIFQFRYPISFIFCQYPGTTNAFILQ